MAWTKKIISLIITIVLIVVLVLPLGINALYLIGTDCSILHEPSEWTTFWGSYLGGIISAGVAFIILHIQRNDNEKQNRANRKNNEIENRENRQLQLNVLRYQQEQLQLDNFILRSSKLIAALNPLALKTVCKRIQQNNVSAIEADVLNRLDVILNIQQEFCLHLSGDNKAQKQFGDNVNIIVDHFKDVLCNIQNFLIIISVTGIPIRYQLLREYAEVSSNMSEELRNAIISYTPSPIEDLKPEMMWEGIMLSLVDELQGEHTRLYNLIDDYVSYERKRIEKILTDVI